MLYDTLGVIKLDHLPEVSAQGVATIVYLGQEFEGFVPGFYAKADGEWLPLGAGGGGVTSDTITTLGPQTINLADYNPDGLILSVLVTKNVAGSRNITLVKTDTGVALEAVVLTETYTTISIPQPHKLYYLQAEGGLTLNIKTI